MGSRDRERAQACAARHRARPGFTDLTDMLADPRLDAVVLATTLAAEAVNEARR